MFGYSAVQQFYVLHAYGLIDNSFEKSIENTISLIENNIAEIRATTKSVAEKM